MNVGTQTESDPVAITGTTQSDPEEAPLVFWAGPLKLATIRLPVVRVTHAVDPFDEALVEPPDMSALPRGVVGVFRSSEPQPESGAEALRKAGSENQIRYVVKKYSRRFIDLRGDFDGYMGSFSRKTRSTLRRKVRKFAAESGGEVDWRTYRTPDEIMEFYAHARSVSAMTYQEKLFDAGIPEGAGFIAYMKNLAAEGNLRGYLLFLAGQPVAYLYCPIYDIRVVYGFLGFDPTHSALSPGTVLQLLATEQLFEEGRFRLFDFTEGDGEHKALFSTHERRCEDVFYLKPGLAIRLLIVCHRGLNGLFDAFDRLVTGTGLRTWLRQKLRGQRR
jgi:hypothetical protein